MNQRDWNYERYRTRDRLLEYNLIPYPIISSTATLPQIYPCENIELSILSKQILEIAQKYGYTGDESAFWEYFQSGSIIIGTLENFPIPGKENYLYLDTEANSLYCYKILSLTEDISSFDTTKVRIVELNENYHLYVPIKSIAVISA